MISRSDSSDWRFDPKGGVTLKRDGQTLKSPSRRPEEGLTVLECGPLDTRRCRREGVLRCVGAKERTRNPKECGREAKTGKRLSSKNRDAFSVRAAWDQQIKTEGRAVSSVVAQKSSSETKHHTDFKPLTLAEASNHCSSKLPSFSVNLKTKTRGNYLNHFRFQGIK